MKGFYVLLIALGWLVSVCQSVADKSKILTSVQNFQNGIRWYEFIEDSKIVLLIDGKGTLFRSENEGFNFTKVKTNRPISDIYLHEYEHNRVYLLSYGYAEVEISLDYAKNFEVRALPLVPATFSQFQGELLDFHPSYPDTIMFSGQSGCPGSSCHSAIYLSRDSGRTWTQLITYAVKCNFAWDQKFQALPRDSIFCEVFQVKSGNQASGANAKRDLVRSDYFVFTGIGDVWLSDVLGYFVIDNFLAVGKVEQEADGPDLHIYISKTGDRLDLVQFPPIRDVDTFMVTLLEGTAGNIFLNFRNPASSTSNSAGTRGNIWASNVNGTFYSLSLENTNQIGGWVDFQWMDGMNGVYLANVQVPPFDGNPMIQSRITYDNGVTWHRIRAPSHDSQGNMYPCWSQSGSACYLHLHGDSSYDLYDYIGGTETAPGLMAAIGNVGPVLGSWSSASTFFTRDAGRTWFEVGKGRYIIEYADQGALLVMAQDQVDTNEFFFSTDFGASWTSAPILSDPSLGQVRVFMIDNAWDSNSRVFLFVVELLKSKKITIITVDMRNIFDRKCILSTESSTIDYEPFYPTLPPLPGGNNPFFEGERRLCVFGHQIKIWRKKPDAECYIDQGWNGPLTEVDGNCPCSLSDFECSDGFWRERDGRCLNYTDTLPVPAPSFCSAGQTFFLSSGYSKVKGSTCELGLPGSIADLADANEYPCVEPMVRQDFSVLSEPLHVIRLSGSSVIVVLTKFGQIMLSGDEGRSWTQINADEDPITIRSVVYYPFLNPFSYGDLYLMPGVVGKGSPIHVRKDGTYSKWSNCPCHILSSNEPGLQVNPFIPGSAYPALICHSAASERKDGLRTAYYSLDNGISWRTLRSSVRECFWSQGDLDPATTIPPSNTRIFPTGVICVEPNPSAVVNISKQMNQLAFSSDFFYLDLYYGLPGNLHVIAVSGNEQLVFVHTIDPYNNEIKLHVSQNGGRDFSLALYTTRKSYGDFESADHMSSTLTAVESLSFFQSSTDGRPFLLVRKVHPSSGYLLPWADLYGGNANGTYFTLSQRNVYLNSEANFDLSGTSSSSATMVPELRELSSMRGFYLVNAVSNTDQVLDQGVAVDLVTLVTYDDGATWSRIGVSNHLCEGLEPCHLNLQLSERVTSGSASTSVKFHLQNPMQSVPGLAIFLGNVGPTLVSLKSTSAPHTIMTFGSRDGGLTWIQLLGGVSDLSATGPSAINSGLFSVSVGDAGNLLVFAKDRIEVSRSSPGTTTTPSGGSTTTTSLLYSGDGGQTTRRLNLTNAIPSSPNSIPLIETLAIVADGQARSHVFTLFARRRDLAAGGGSNANVDFIVLRLDLSNFYGARVCSATPYDLTSWSPSNGEICFQGQQLEFKRRKTGRFCKTDPNLPIDQGHAIRPNCPCTRSDYECDFEFSLTGSGVTTLDDNDNSQQQDTNTKSPLIIVDHSASTGQSSKVCKASPEFARVIMELPCAAALGLTNANNISALISGYRVIGGNTCVGSVKGLQPAATFRDCDELGRRIGPGGRDAPGSGVLVTVGIVGATALTILFMFLGCRYGKISAFNITTRAGYGKKAATTATSGYSRLGAGAVVTEDEIDDAPLDDDEEQQQNNSPNNGRNSTRNRSPSFLQKVLDRGWSYSPVPSSRASNTRMSSPLQLKTNPSLISNNSVSENTDQLINAATLPGSPTTATATTVEINGKTSLSSPRPLIEASQKLLGRSSSRAAESVTSFHHNNNNNSFSYGSSNAQNDFVKSSSVNYHESIASGSTGNRDVTVVAEERDEATAEWSAFNGGDDENKPLI